MPAQSPAFNGDPIVEMADLTAKALIANAGTLIGSIGQAPRQVQFQLAPRAATQLANNKEMQFRFTAKYPDGSWYTNRNDAYVPHPSS